MNDRSKVLAFAIAGLALGLPLNHFAKAAPAPMPPAPHQEAREKDEEHGEKHGWGGKHEQHEEHEDGEGKKDKDYATAVPTNMVPQLVMDAVKKEVPNGTVTEAELEVKKDKIVYSFDVKDGETVYDVVISVEGKFVSKELDDAADEKAELGGEEESDEKDEAKAKK